MTVSLSDQIALVQRRVARWKAWVSADPRPETEHQLAGWKAVMASLATLESMQWRRIETAPQQVRDLASAIVSRPGSHRVKIVQGFDGRPPARRYPVYAILTAPTGNRALAWLELPDPFLPLPDAPEREGEQ